MWFARTTSPLWRRSKASALAAAAIFTVSVTVSCAPEVSTDPGLQDTASNANPSSQLVGRWLPQEPANQNAFVEFGVEGTYFSSDGCNTASGGWQLEADGSFFASSGGGTEIGCRNVPIPKAVADATTISFDDKNTLVISGHEDPPMRLSRTESEAMTLVASWIGPASNITTSRIDFEADGTWTGYVGCHEYRGEWRIRIVEEDSTYPEEASGHKSGDLT